MPRVHDIEAVEAMAERFPALYLEKFGNLTEVAVELGLGKTPAGARKALISLMQNECMQKAHELALAMQCDKFREVATKMGCGVDAGTRNNYAGMKFLETREPHLWNPKHVITVEDGAFSAEAIKRAAADGDGEGASVIDFMRARVEIAERDAADEAEADNG